MGLQYELCYTHTYMYTVLLNHKQCYGANSGQKILSKKKSMEVTVDLKNGSIDSINNRCNSPSIQKIDG